MVDSRANGIVLIWLSFVVALILQAAPWPGQLEAFRPSWVMLVAFLLGAGVATPGECRHGIGTGTDLGSVTGFYFGYSRSDHVSAVLHSGPELSGDAQFILMAAGHDSRLAVAGRQAGGVLGRIPGGRD